MSEEKPSTSRPVREPGVMLSDLTDDLLWPRILRAPALALSPSRLITGAVCAFLLAALLYVVALLTPAQPQTQARAQPTQPTVLERIATEPLAPPAGAHEELELVGRRFDVIIDNIVGSITALDPLPLARSVGYAAVVIRDTVMQSPLLSLLVGIPLIAILALAGASISRSAAIEFAQGRFASRDDTLGFALRRARQFVGAVVGPVVFSALLFLLIAIGGLLLSVPLVDIVGAILYAVGLALGVVATVVLMLHVVALPLIVPALAIEGSDGFDAVQRAYAYVIGRPLRYLLYAVLLMTLGALAAAVFTMIASTAIGMTDWAATFFTNDAASRVLSGQGEMGATKSSAHQIVQIWRTVVELLTAGYVISLFFTSSTLLYLVTRRVCDGQDVNEIWEPAPR